MSNSLSTSIFDQSNTFSSFVDDRSWEPGWLADFRMENWNLYQDKLQSKLKDENWRFSPKSRFSLSEINSIADSKDLLCLESENSSNARFLDFNKMILDFPSEISKITDYLGPELGALSNYYLTSSLFNDGFFLKSEPNTRSKQFFTVRHYLPSSGAVSFRKNVLVISPYTEVTILEFIESKPDAGGGNLSSVLHAELEENAVLNRILVQDADSDSTLHQFENFKIGKNARVNNVCVHLGSAQCRNEIKGDLSERGAEFDCFSLFLGKGNQLFDQRTMQLHSAENCRSNLLCKNALNDESKSVFSGMIKVMPNAANTNSYQTNRNLLLSNTSEADSLPGLEILANEVKCSHGATTSKIDDQELFYLLSRGIPKKSAENLIALGFLDEITSKITDEQCIELVRQKIDSRF